MDILLIGGSRYSFHARTGSLPGQGDIDATLVDSAQIYITLGEADGRLAVNTARTIIEASLGARLEITQFISW